MSKYLVLGSGGQIGTALTDYLKRNNHAVIEFDIINDGEQDLRIHRNELLDKCISEADFIFFLAFDVGGSRYLKIYQNTYDFISNNTKIINHTFELIHRHRKPFIFASSQMSNMDYSNYGRLKAVGESFTRSLDGLVVKFWNVYGLERDMDKSHVITDLIIKAWKNNRIDLLTDGTEERQFLYADDCCEALVTLSEKYATIPRDKELHITNFKWEEVLQVASIIGSHFPGSIIIPSEARDEVQKYKRNEPDEYILEHWRPRTTLEQGITKIVEGMKKEPELYLGNSIVDSLVDNA